jgi:hypothetical protein
MGLGWLGLILTAVTAVVAAFATDFMSIRSYTSAALKGAWAYIKSFWGMVKAFARNVGDIFGSLGKIILGAMRRSWSEVKAGFVGLKAAMQSAGEDVSEVWKKAGDEAALAWLEAKKKRLEDEKEAGVMPKISGAAPVATASTKEEQEIQDRLMALRFKTNRISLADYTAYLQKKIDAIQGTSNKELLAREELEAKIQALNDQAVTDAKRRADGIYKYQVQSGRLLWEETHAAEIAMQEQATSIMMAGYDTFWSTITDRAMTGKQRIEAMWDAMKQQFIRIVSAQVKAFLFGEKVKQAESKKTTAALIADYIAQAAKSIWAAGASIVSAIASGFQWLVATLGPFGLAAGIALGAGIIAAFTGIKSAMGFVSGGFTGEGGKDDPAGVVHKGEYVIPAWLMKRVPELVGSIERMRTGAISTLTRTPWRHCSAPQLYHSQSARGGAAGDQTLRAG